MIGGMDEKQEKLYAELQAVTGDNQRLLQEIQEIRGVKGEERKHVPTSAEVFIQNQEAQMAALHKQITDTVTEVAVYEQELRRKDGIIATQLEEIRTLRRSDVSPKVDEQEAMIMELQDEIEILRQRKNERQDEIDILKQQKNETQRKSGEQEIARTELEQKISRLTSTLQERDDTLREQEADIKKQAATLRQKELIHEKDLQKCTKRVSQSHELLEENSQLKETCEKLEEQRNQAAAETQIVANAIQGLHSEISAKEKELVAAKNERAALEEKCDQLAQREQQLVDMEDYVLEQKRITKELEIKADKAEALVADITSKLENAESSAAEATHMLGKAENNTTEVATRLQNAEARASEAERKLIHVYSSEEVETTLRDAEARVAEAERRVTYSEEEVATKLRDAEARAAEAERRLESVEQSGADGTTKLEKAEALAAEATRMLDSAVYTTAESTTRLQNAEASAAEAERKLQQTIKQHEEYVTSTQFQINCLLGEMKECQRIKEGCEAELQAHKRSSELLDQRISRLDKALSESCLENEALRHSFSKQEVAVNELRNSMQEAEVNDWKAEEVVVQAYPVQDTVRPNVNHMGASTLLRELLSQESPNATGSDATTHASPMTESKNSDPVQVSRDDDLEMKTPPGAVASARPGKTMSVRDSVRVRQSIVALALPKCQLQAPRVSVNPPRALARKSAPGGFVPEERITPDVTPRLTTPVFTSPRLFLGPRPTVRKSTTPLRRDISPSIEIKREILRKGRGTGGGPRRSKVTTPPAPTDERDSWIF